MGEKTYTKDGYNPIIEKGYKPSDLDYYPQEKIIPFNPEPQGGYQPTINQGNNPTNQPVPPKEE